jgi:hypothetical protein
MASLGVSGDVDFKTKKGGKLETDEQMDGLVKSPENMGELLGVADLQPNSFEKALAGISKKSGELDEKTAKAQGSLQALLSMVEPCKQEGLAKLAEKAQKDLDSLNTNRCFYSKEICDRDDALSSLLSDLQSAGMGGGDSGSVDALYNGISDFCAKSDIVEDQPVGKPIGEINREMQPLKNKQNSGGQLTESETNRLGKLEDQLAAAQQEARKRQPTNPGSCASIYNGLSAKTEAISEAAKKRVSTGGRAGSGL